MNLWSKVKPILVPRALFLMTTDETVLQKHLVKIDGYHAWTRGGLTFVGGELKMYDGITLKFDGILALYDLIREGIVGEKK